MTALPARDPAKPNTEQGLYRKFEVRRTDGSDQPGGKHHGCEYFVLDVTHDPFAKPALAAYAAAAADDYPQLATDMHARYRLKPGSGVAGWELIERVAKHMADSIHYIEHVYEGAPTLDRGPIMRNMKRWRDRLHEAIAARALSGNAPDGYTLVPIILPPLAVSEIKDMLAQDYSVHDHAARPLWARVLAIVAGIPIEDQDRHFAAEKGRAPAPLPKAAVETTPVPLDAPPPKFNPLPAEAQGKWKALIGAWQRRAEAAGYRGIEGVLEAVEAEAQPVAWRFQYQGEWRYTETPQREVERAHGFEPAQPLYAHPPPSTPVGVDDAVIKELRSLRSKHLAYAAQALTNANAAMHRAKVSALDVAIALAQQPAAVDGTLRVVGQVVRHLIPGQPEGKSVIWNDLPEAGTTLYALAAQQGGADT